MLYDFIGAFGAATLDDITPHFDVAERTVRRDLELLVMVDRLAVIYTDDKTKWRRVSKPPAFV